MRRLSIQLRLSLWYFASLATIVALLAACSWFAMRASMYHSVDRDLQYRISSVVPFVQSRALNTREQFVKTMMSAADASVVGVFVQVTNAQQDILYQSELLASHHAPVISSGKPDGSISISTVGDPGWPLRVASQRIVVAGVPLTVHVVEPLRDLLDALREYSMYLALLAPLALLLTTIAGYWMSRRALAPVEEIRSQAEAIDPANLTARLQVPPTDDELARLALTLNAMLSRIEVAFRSIERFTADASHELRAPLALILTAGEVSLRKPRTAEELAEVLQKITREARHMSDLVENLLNLARGDAHPDALQQSTVDLTALLRELCAALRTPAEAKGLALTQSLPDHEARIISDATEMRRLFLILLDNAIKYTESGSIHVMLEFKEKQVMARIADTGIGIEQSALPHVFDRFWRVDKVRSRASGGVGLGLSLAEQIVQRHHGTISVESEIGRGTTFLVQFPATQPSDIALISGTMHGAG